MIDQPKTVTVSPEPDVQVVTIFRDKKMQRVVEREQPESDVFSVGEFYAGITVNVKNLGMVQARVHLKGAMSATDALWRFDELVKANMGDAVNAELKRRHDFELKMRQEQAGQIQVPR